MTKVKLKKDNIFIEGFDSQLSIEVWRNSDRNPIHWSNILYSGKTSEVPEKLAEEICYEYIQNEGGYGERSLGFKNYIDNIGGLIPKESIKSACSEEYCVIYKEL